MKLTVPLQVIKDEKYWYRIWGYWRSPAMMRMLGLWSDRKDQQLRTMLNAQRGPGKSRGPSIYEKLSEPKYKVKWIRYKEEGPAKKTAV